MRSWSPERIASAADARLRAPLRSGTPGPRTPPPDARRPTGSSEAGPDRAIIDSREAGPGALFIGLPGAHTDGGAFAARALSAGAWGVLVAPEHIERARRAGSGVLFAAEDPLAALQRLAAAWRRDLDAQVIGITGSTGKTSTKDLLLAVLGAHRRTVASRLNFNTEVGLPLEILSAPPGTEVLVLEMGMRGPGQIAQLARIAQPQVGVIVSIGPVHLERLGSVAAIAAAKAELIAALPAGGTAVVPAGEPLLEPHLRGDIEIVTFGDGGDVQLHAADGGRIEIDLSGRPIRLEVPFSQAHQRTNLLAAVAAARAVGVIAAGRLEPRLSPGRGQRVALRDGITIIDDCYNANPVSMRAALDDLADTAAREDHTRAVAVLGDMLELGSDARTYHLEIGEHAGTVGVDVLVTVGSLAAAMGERFDGEVHAVVDAGEAAAIVAELLAPGDAVLVKGSRGVGLELVCRGLQASRLSTDVAGADR
ncbi:MAG: UDP-N-acetylmuramoyl-tripeptide--D-alanyl-D-alanine ligase [Solirubrobacteraceae bacterium]